MSQLHIIFSIIISSVILIVSACASMETRSLEGIGSHFEKHGIEVTDRIPKSYEMIGAMDGYGCSLNGKEVEIYLYESESTVLKKAKEKGRILDSKAVVNDNIVMVIVDDIADKTLEVFAAY